MADGALFHQQHALVDRAVLPAHGSTSGEFIIPISGEILDAVERQRTDGVALTIQGQLVIAPVLQYRKASDGGTGASGTPERPPLLGIPVTTLGTGEYDAHMVNHRIPRSEWTQLITRWRWSDIELFEIALSPRSGSVESTQAYTMLRQAERSFREFDFRATLTHCRAALEAFAMATGDGDLKRGYEAAITAKVGGEEMRKDLNTLLRSLNDFAHAGRHARLPDEPVTRDDALFVLRMTLGALERLAR